MNEGIQAATATASHGKWDAITKVIGPVDLHYHFRSRPLLKFFARQDPNQKTRVLEFGCGEGANLFALRERLPGMTGLGVDIDPRSIGRANALATERGTDGMDFVCADSMKAFDFAPASFDYALLIDVLEHLNDPGALLLDINRLLKPDGTILISVPTHRYPRVFGREFHNAVGHVRDGFNMTELDDLLGPLFERTQSSYNTGLLAGAACAAFYRGVPKISSRKLAIITMLGLHLSRLADFFNGPSVSSSIWAVYRRRA
ncbi:class I SAM-dependent methyltransferase [Dyella japonica]|uniref:Methyltransferase domain-containing protein n=1 Tax=Dyella japonica A8 TaxID=1217721 RepID=A0A075JXN5_9GAMM|nr:class I SAM-dependent methyltransferase [Dyella japonica]AIF46345.1 hypothetical protein HY57_03285 [Dyella japonica A8]